MVNALEAARTKATGDPIDLSVETHFSHEEATTLNALLSQIVTLQEGHESLWQTYANALKNTGLQSAAQMSLLESNLPLAEEMEALLKNVADIIR